MGFTALSPSYKFYYKFYTASPKRGHDSFTEPSCGFGRMPGNAEELQEESGDG